MKISNKKRVMVTGGAGFLGSHLCERLLDENCDVLCVDNFYSGTKLDHIIGLLIYENYKLSKMRTTTAGPHTYVMYFV
jgi:UDP-glucuronate decarboxylase